MESHRTIIKVRDLTVRFGDYTVLDSVSFDVYEGEVFVILGGSGCGKTTLLRAMIGLLRPESGQVLIDGVDLVNAEGSERGEIMEKIGVLFQSGALFKSMTLGDNVALPLKESTELSDDLITDIVRMKLAMVSLEGSEKLMPSELSGGMQKRAALARAIALDPKILFFDEPSAGLDPVTAAGLDKLILGINTGRKTTMIVVTHELQSIFAIARRAIMLDRESHRIIAEGTPVEMRDHSDHPLVRAFFRREVLEDETHDGASAPVETGE